MNRYIDVNEVEKLLRAGCAYAIWELPSIDIIRCKECKHSEYREDFDDYECHASGCGLVYDAEFYCADGEYKENE